MPSIEKFKESLSLFRIDDNVIAQINEGYSNIDNKAPQKVRYAYFKRALDIMETQVDYEKLKEVFEWNACCKGGVRAMASNTFAKENEYLSIDERIEKIKYVSNMGSPVRNQDGTITVNAVSYWRDGRFLCACSNCNGLNLDYKMSKNYCFCCAGHFKHHYEIMLGVALKTLEIISSPLDSDGKNPCIIKFAISN
ncbi:MAG: hypothetical protein E7521_01355 [Ruminococcaceae bacterium]|nr:hypothetical protein [Oscillospiraceae bacterium]